MAKEHKYVYTFGAGKAEGDASMRNLLGGKGANLAEIGGKVGELIKRERFEETMAALAARRRPVDEFFDKVTVNVDVPELRQNRLRLLSRIRAVMNQVADFSQIEG